MPLRSLVSVAGVCRLHHPVRAGQQTDVVINPTTVETALDHLARLRAECRAEELAHVSDEELSEYPGARVLSLLAHCRLCIHLQESLRNRHSLDAHGVKREADGAIIAIQGIYRDITEELDPIRRLRESEQRLRLFVESSPDAVFVQTGGRFAYVNPATVRLFGVAGPDALLGTEVAERAHPDYRESVRERLRLLNEEKTPVPVLDEVYLRVDGTPVPVSVVVLTSSREERDVVDS